MKKGTLAALTLFVMMALGMGFIGPQQAEAQTEIPRLNWEQRPGEGGLFVSLDEDPKTFIIVAEKGNTEIGIYLNTEDTRPVDDTDITTFPYASADELVEFGKFKGTFPEVEKGVAYFFGVYQKTVDTDEITHYTYYQSYGNDPATQIPAVELTDLDEGGNPIKITNGDLTNYVIVGKAPELTITTDDASATKEGENIVATAKGTVTNTEAISELFIIKAGVCWGDSANPTAVEPDEENCQTVELPLSDKTFTVTIPSDKLELEKTYYANVFVENGAGRVYGGGDKSFSTAKPVVETTSANPGTTFATLIGSVATGGFTERGFVWSETNNDPEIDGTDVTKAVSDTPAEELAFSVKIEGLTEDEDYYYRAYAKNDFGIGYGVATKNFNTFISGDFDNSNSAADLADAIVCLKVSAGITATAYAGADVSGNGKVDTADAAFILMNLATP